MKDKAYLYGVLMGDGFYGYRGKKSGNLPDYVMLKTIDGDFAEHFSRIVEKLTGKKYKIYLLKREKKNWNKLHLCKCYAPEIVHESLELTHNRTEIPNFVKDGDDDIKKAFLEGLMDSEGWVTCSLNPLKQSNIGLWFGNTASWTKDVWRMFQDVGIEVSKIYYRKFKDGRKEVMSFKINILDYVDSGMYLHIKRKSDRLDFISTILRDYTYGYKNSYRDDVQEIVQPVAKAVG